MEINKIILIGNGFDLSHNLKTSYGDFIAFILKKELTNLIYHIRTYNDYDSDLYSVTINQGSASLNYDAKFISENNIKSLSNKELYRIGINIKDYFKKCEGVNIAIKNLFLINILNEGIINWVDLEDIYFKTLLKTKDSDIQRLNNDFQDIKNLFEDYLHTQVIPFIEQITSCSTIEEIIYCDIDNKELSNVFLSEINQKDIETKKEIKTKEIEAKKLENALKNFRNKITRDQDSFRSTEEELYVKEEEITNLYNELHFINKNSSENIFFINFNYTNTFEKYKESDSTSIYIHGKLKDESNPIILGYGDERADEYKLLESKSNEFLKNIKSFSYSNTNNYKNLIRIIESNPFQIVILGHSCGMSDRVLLSTLFEHKNCISIKPYYYLNEIKGTDNYQDIIMNISRNFINKSKMRDLIVDKVNTKPYSIIKKEEVPELQLN